MQHANYTMLVLLVLFCFPVLYHILKAHGGKTIFIRPIAGLDAIDEAIGRATEMGRPIFFSPGLGDLDVTTLSALAILKHIATKAAQYGIRVLVTVNSYLIYPIAEEICREAYLKVGKGDLFNPEDVIFIAGQFPYAAGSVGIMQREKVAASFFFGSFFAEALILAEGGNQIGAIQVAGTSSSLQVPFFITACDFTIIGEELFAASAYITQEPTMLGSLVGQDIGKILIMTLVMIGVIFQTIVELVPTLGYNWFAELLQF